MGLLDDIRDANVPVYPRCSVAITLDSLDAETAAELAEAIDDPSLTATAIDKVMVARGIPLRAYSIRRHRQGACSCR